MNDWNTTDELRALEVMQKKREADKETAERRELHERLIAQICRVEHATREAGERISSELRAIVNVLVALCVALAMMALALLFGMAK